MEMMIFFESNVQSVSFVPIDVQSFSWGVTRRRMREHRDVFMASTIYKQTFTVV